MIVSVKATGQRLCTHLCNANEALLATAQAMLPVMEHQCLYLKPLPLSVKSDSSRQQIAALKRADSSRPVFVLLQQPFVSSVTLIRECLCRECHNCSEDDHYESGDKNYEVKLILIYKCVLECEMHYAINYCPLLGNGAICIGSGMQ